MFDVFSLFYLYFSFFFRTFAPDFGHAENTTRGITYVLRPQKYYFFLIYAKNLRFFLHLN